MSEKHPNYSEVKCVKYGISSRQFSPGTQADSAFAGRGCATDFRRGKSTLSVPLILLDWELKIPDVTLLTVNGHTKAVW